MRILDSSCQYGGDNRDIKVHRVRIMAVWLFHGALAASCSFFSSSTGNPCTHWWVEMNTIDDDKWFCAQFNKDHDLVLSQHGSLNEVTIAGALEKRKHSNIKEKATFYPDNVTMGDVYDWMERYDSNYNLITNNCQDFGDAFSLEFGHVRASNNPFMHALDEGIGVAKVASVMFEIVDSPEQISVVRKFNQEVLKPTIIIAQVSPPKCIVS